MKRTYIGAMKREEISGRLALSKLVVNVFSKQFSKQNNFRKKRGLRFSCFYGSNKGANKGVRVLFGVLFEVVLEDVLAQHARVRPRWLPEIC